MIKVPLALLSPREGEWLKIETETPGVFAIQLRRPTAGEMLQSVVASWKSHADALLARIACVADWNGVVDSSGCQVGYSRSRLEALMAVYPEVAVEVAAKLADWFAAPSADAKKNSVSTSPESSVEPPADR